MQEGSIVKMIKPMDKYLWEGLKQYMGIPPPIPGDDVYVVSGMGSEEECKALDTDISIYLEEYPEYSREGIPFDGNLFTELLPPIDIEIEEENLAKVKY